MTGARSILVIVRCALAQLSWVPKLIVVLEVSGYESKNIRIPADAFC